MRLLKYLFPRRRLQQRLPLLSRDPSSDQSPYTDDPDPFWVRRLMAAGCAKSRQDAIRLIRRYPGVGIDQLIRSERRRRRLKSRIGWAWFRFRRMW